MHTAFEVVRTGPDGGVLVELHDGQLQATALQLGYALDAEQGVATQVEEIVVDANLVDGEQIGPHGCDRFLHLSAGAHIGHVEVGTLHIGHGQGLAIDLATGGTWHLAYGHKGRGYHVIRQG